MIDYLILHAIIGVTLSVPWVIIARIEEFESFDDSMIYAIVLLIFIFWPILLLLLLLLLLWLVCTRTVLGIKGIPKIYKLIKERISNI